MTAGADTRGARLGMWLFLFTEIMLFGGLFVLYAAYYFRYRPDFIAGGARLELGLGALNTVLLLVSSFTAAAACRAVERRPGRSAALLAVTVALGLAFLGNKYVEWGDKFGQGIMPGSERMLGLPRGQQIFFGMYFMLTGLHALHVLAGTAVLGAFVPLALRSRLRPVVLDNGALYWHLVDIVWIYLFPLLYLIP